MKRREAVAGLAGLAVFGPAGLARQGGAVDDKHEVKTDRAPKAIGPYSQAIVAGGMVYVSGQIPIDPATGELNAGSIEDQTRQVLKNVAAVLEAAGSSMDKVVRTGVFLQDMNEFARMNQVYGEVFKAPYPARATIQAARLPRDVRVEIEAVALLK
jgi:2-iminobutanoate/2-iminopropanoate deaminase